MIGAYLGTGLQLLPSYMAYLPELCSAIALLIVIARLFGGARIRLHWGYGLAIGLLLFVIVFGIAVQGVESGPIVYGLRWYLKALPFLLLPAVYPFTEKQIRAQIIWLFAIMSVQTPLAFYQKYFQFKGHWNTGDYITGTLITSGVLSLIMLCGIAAIVVLYLRDRIRFVTLLLCVGFLLAPTTINETKITILLLPLTILLPILVMPRRQRSLTKVIPILITGGVAAVAFLSIYAYFAQFEHGGMALGEFFENKKALESYLLNNGNKHRSGTIGRGDTLVYAMKKIERDPIIFGFGVGAGNASQTKQKQFEGKYSKYFAGYGIGQTQITYWLWEIGVVGVLTYVLIFVVAFRDAVVLARSDSPFALLAPAWATVIVILSIALFYQTIFGMDQFQYAFWFYSGLCASKLWELRAARAAVTSHPLRQSPVRTPAAAI
jgi:hypothetical protein